MIYSYQNATAVCLAISWQNCDETSIRNINCNPEDSKELGLAVKSSQISQTETIDNLCVEIITYVSQTLQFKREKGNDNFHKIYKKNAKIHEMLEIDITMPGVIVGVPSLATPIHNNANSQAFLTLIYSRTIRKGGVLHTWVEGRDKGGLRIGGERCCQHWTRQTHLGTQCIRTYTSRSVRNLLTDSNTVATAHLQEVRSQANLQTCVDLSLLTHLRNMSSKRKSPPTKLHEGTNPSTESITTLQPIPQPGSGSEGGNLTDLDETSSNNLSDICEEDTNTMVHNSNPFYKLSESSSPGSVSGSEVDEVEEDRTPPNKTARMMCPSESNILMSSSIQALSLHNEPERRRNSSECSSPNSDLKANIHYNNNNSSLHNNNSFPNPLKRSMDDVLKRLTSKINNSTIREEKRPTPSSTPNSVHNSDVEPTTAIQQALSGDNIMEKDRKLSELIFQLQMVREQLVTQKQQEPNKTGARRDGAIPQLNNLKMGIVSRVIVVTVTDPTRKAVAIGWHQAGPLNPLVILVTDELLLSAL
ncbi:hypothetical protein JTB14_034305 [Gonioctena quinquepunctata]|nr:hypothetical protein JTB14_034305 [Gonioctena quinquepunctata]